MHNESGKTWLITGSSSGLGLEISLAVLQAGDRVICTARSVDRAAREHPEVERLGGKWLELDVTSEDTEQVVADAVKSYGARLDVVINNAGYMVLSSLEDARMDDLKTMMETHVFGTIRVMKGALPTLRAQNSGMVINMSSFSGIVGHAGAGLYCMCKFALEGISEVWQAELAPFNIRVVILEPGAFRTPILQRAMKPSGAPVYIGTHYLETAAGKTISLIKELAEKADTLVAGDPAKLAQRVIEIVRETGFGKGLHDVLRFPMGKDARGLIEPKIEKLQRDFQRTQMLAKSTDFDSHVGSGAIDL